MSEITHDSDPKKELELAFGHYLNACYGGTGNLSSIKYHEVSQAFFSGVHTLNTFDGYDPEEIHTALEHLLGMEN